MANDKIGGQKIPTFIPQQQDAGRVQQARSTQAQQAPQRIDVSDIPERSDVNAKSSPLAGLLAQGLATLADSKGWNSTQKSLDVLVSAMGASANARSTDAVVNEAVGQMRTRFSSLLRGMVDVTPETLAMIKEDAPKLVQLAVVALGMADLDGKKAGQQLVTDLTAVRSALEDVIKKPAAERAAFVQEKVKDLSMMASVFDRAGGALDAAKVDASTRYTALTGIFEIIARYANPAADAQS